MSTMNQPWHDRQWLQERYWYDRLGTGQIGKLVDVHGETVRYWMNKLGVELRDAAEAKAVNRGSKNAMHGVTGSDHPSWRGGQDEFYTTKRWQQLRKRIYQRDDHQCVRCGATDCEVHAHHAQPVSKGGDIWDMTNIETLCVPCHRDAHGGEKVSL